MSPRHGTVEIAMAVRDFSRAIISDLSERGIKKINWLAGADNLYGRPLRSCRVRPGSRDLSTAILPEEPHSLMGFYSLGSNKLFVAGGKNVYEVQSGAYALQTLATPLTAIDTVSHTNLEGALILAQHGAATTAQMFDGGWKDLKLPKPASAVTFAADDNTGGTVDAGTHYFRVRHRYARGNSLVGPVSAAHVVAAPNLTVHIATNLVPAAPRSDYAGWTLEMTKVNGTANGPWYWVADGTASTFAVTLADSQLGYRADEGLHGEPPNFDGVTGFAGRLFGWAGSTLYASQASGGDLEQTGIANFDFDNVYQVAKDDGDTIQVCLVVLDALLILKKRSVHVLSGADPDSFVLTSVVYADPSRGSEAGCAGPRAACVIGGVAYFWGESGGLFRYEHGTVKPVGWQELGRYLDNANPAAVDRVCLVNHQGNYMLAWHATGTSNIPSEQIILDARYTQWWHWKGWAARDAIELKSGILGNAQLAFCDPTNRLSFPAIANAASVTGAGIPGGTTINGAVALGAQQLALSANATATAVDVTLTIAGVDTPHCKTTNGSSSVTIGGYRCWAGFDGFRDEKDSTGAGGNGVTVRLETPWLDGGMPDDWKDLDRIAVTADGDQVAVSVSIQTDPGGGETNVQLSTSGQGYDWAPDSGSGTNDLEWDVGDWAGDAPTTVAGGVPFGTIGRRFKFVFTAVPIGDFRPTGIEMVAMLLPDKEYDS